VAGCAATKAMVKPSSRVFSLGFDIPKGIPTSGIWLAADCRLLRFSDTQFLKDIGMNWQEAPGDERLDAARFALLTSGQVAQLAEKGRGSARFAPLTKHKDPQAFLLMRAGSSVANSTPRFCVPARGKKLLEITVTPSAVWQGSGLELTIAAAEYEPDREAPPENWAASATVPVTGRCVLIHIPTAREHLAGTSSPVMVMLVPQTFVWRDGEQDLELPWGRKRRTFIKGRNISNRWLKLERQ